MHAEKQKQPVEYGSIYLTFQKRQNYREANRSVLARDVVQGGRQGWIGETEGIT